MSQESVKFNYKLAVKLLSRTATADEVKQFVVDCKKIYYDAVALEYSNTTLLSETKRLKEENQFLLNEIEKENKNGIV